MLRWRLESATDAREFTRALGAYVEDGLGGSSAGPGLWTVEGGSVAAARNGYELTLAFAPDADLASSIVTPEGPVGELD